jgi:LmeA-like phospholipid-binding
VYNYQPRKRRRGGRLLVILLISLIVLLVGADFAARAVAQNVLASQIQQRGFPARPKVSIAGFPFLTQVITRDLKHVTIAANNVRTGPVTISAISVVADGVHIHSNLHGATIDRMHGTAFIGFGSLARALTSQIGPLGSSLVGGAGLTLRQVSKDTIRASVDLVVTQATITWRITRVNGHEINVRVLKTSGDLPSELFSAVQSVNLPLPSLPMGLQLQSLSVTQSGVRAVVTGRALTVSG